MNVYPNRDLIGYGRKPPRARWPGDARVAINFVLNYEEGAEYCVLNGDPHSETALSDLSGLVPLEGARHLNVESVYEYGSRVGAWRVFELFRERGVPLTVYAVGLALELNPAVADVIRDNGYDVVSHGWRWIDYQSVDEDTERGHIRLCVETIERMTGARPL
ncbi:MAG: polysaccharide deacetylase family protein, partial [Gammaproteobacteria bacterium]|nr:polysaccharide deacetylase family protein [Gammaproteobacteria bacterium]